MEQIVRRYDETVRLDLNTGPTVVWSFQKWPRCFGFYPTVMAAVVGALAAMLKKISPAKKGLRHNMAEARIKFKFPYEQSNCDWLVFYFCYLRNIFTVKQRFKYYEVYTL